MWPRFKKFIRSKAPKDEAELRNATEEFFDTQYSHEEMIKTVEVKKGSI